MECLSTWGLSRHLLLSWPTSNMWEPLKHLQASASQHLAKEVWSIQWQVTPTSMLCCSPAGCCGSYVIDRTKLVMIVLFMLSAASWIFKHSVFLVITVRWVSIISWIMVPQPEKMVGCLLKWIWAESLSSDACVADGAERETAFVIFAFYIGFF